MQGKPIINKSLCPSAIDAERFAALMKISCNLHFNVWLAAGKFAMRKRGW